MPILARVLVIFVPRYAHLRLDWVTVLTAQEASAVAAPACLGTHTGISHVASPDEVQEPLIRVIFLVVPSFMHNEG